jgi:hypothetical protein
MVFFVVVSLSLVVEVSRGILLFSVILVLGYAPAAAWGVRAGGGRLWVVAASALGLLVLGSVLYGYGFTVPNTPLFLLYLLVFTVPGVVLPTLLLWTQRAKPWAQTAALQTAVMAGLVGLGLGWLVVAYGLGVW